MSQLQLAISQCSNSNLSPFIITSEIVRPHPEVQARKISNSRRKRKSGILADTPGNLIIEDKATPYMQEKNDIE